MKSAFTLECPRAINPGLTGMPYYLVSLRDMFEFSLPAWIKTQQALTELRQVFNMDVPEALLVDVERVASPLRTIAAAFLELKLEWTYRATTDLLAELKQLSEEQAAKRTYLQALNNAIQRKQPLPVPPKRDEDKELMDLVVRGERKLTTESFREHVRNLFKTIDMDLSNRVFLSVEPLQVRFYREEYPFGEIVAERFRGAVRDSREAAKCLALDRPTACVFHLMRVMEIGLRAVAKALGIEHATSWERYLDKIDTEMKRRPADQTPDWKASEPFFKDVSAHLNSIKLAWRNPTVHVERDYSSGEAEDIFNAIGVLMRHLATRLSE
jgi:hypothetical protein